MDLLSPAQVAKQLGVGLPYIYTLLASGKLLGFQENGRWRIRQVEVDNWKAHTAQRKKKAITEMAQEAVDDGTYDQVVSIPRIDP